MAGEERGLIWGLGGSIGLFIGLIGEPRNRVGLTGIGGPGGDFFSVVLSAASVDSAASDGGIPALTWVPRLILKLGATTAVLSDVKGFITGVGFDENNVVFTLLMPLVSLRTNQMFQCYCEFRCIPLHRDKQVLLKSFETYYQPFGCWLIIIIRVLIITFAWASAKFPFDQKYIAFYAKNIFRTIFFFLYLSFSISFFPFLFFFSLFLSLSF